MFTYSGKTKSEGTFLAKVVDYEVQGSSWDTEFEFVMVDQNNQPIDASKAIPERYRVQVSISGFEVLEPPVRENLEAKQTDGFAVWLFPAEISKLIECHSHDGFIVFDAGISHHRGIISFVRIHHYLPKIWV